MSIKCSPGYWFLGRTDKPQFILRQTGSAQKFTKNVLLPARITAWKWLVDDASLDEPFTSDNLVTPLVDGEDYMKDSIRICGLWARTISCCWPAGRSR